MYYRGQAVGQSIKKNHQRFFLFIPPPPLSLLHQLVSRLLVYPI